VIVGRVVCNTEQVNDLSIRGLLKRLELGDC
jgi:hypothetical protein